MDLSISFIFFISLSFYVQFNCFFSSTFQFTIFQFKDYIVHSFSYIFKTSVSVSFTILKYSFLVCFHSYLFFFICIQYTHRLSYLLHYLTLVHVTCCCLFVIFSYIKGAAYFPRESNVLRRILQSNFELSSSKGPVGFTNLAPTLCECFVLVP